MSLWNKEETALATRHTPFHRLRAAVVPAALLTTLLLAGAAPARAQLGLLPKVSLKAGVFLPQNTSLANVTSNTWLKVGADVSLPFSLIPLIGSTRAGIDFEVHGSSSIVPITLTQIIQPSAGLKSPIYGGVGVGIWTGHIKGHGSDTKLGARLLAGVDFSKNLFIEAQYDFVGKIGGVNADGFSVLAGVRF